MKLVWFSIVILIIGFGLFWKREPHHPSGDPPVAEATVTATSAPSTAARALATVVAAAIPGVAEACAARASARPG